MMGDAKTKRSKTRSPPAHASPWQDAPTDALGVVLHHVNSLSDNGRIATVCRAWRRAVAQLHPPLPPPLPWLLLPDFNLSRLSPDGAAATGHSLHLPDGTIPECVGSSCDGRVVLLREQRCFAMNPLTGATTSLPEFDLHRGPRKELPYVPANSHGNSPFRVSLPRKVVISSSAPDRGSATCIMAGISGHGPSASYVPVIRNGLHLSPPHDEAKGPPDVDETCYATLFLCRPGDATWSVTTDVRLGATSDIVFHDGRLYFFDWMPDRKLSPRVHALDVGEDASDGALKVTGIRRLPGPIFRGARNRSMRARSSSVFFYLVESRGRLMAVMRECGERRTHAVTVLALDEARRSPYKWATVETLDGEVVFLGPTSSLSVPAALYPGARGDRIYFAQEMCVDGCPSRKDCRYQHCEVFDMRTRVVEAVCLGTAPRPDCWCWCPTWFVPSQQTYPDTNS
ncbi:hypothetical protein QOZ80_1BG0086560 [Eleusine coracana subsp. coracana]|nr:hypothetical protein QOZ80_1BG0086560 [Eleusine coracana subsp. coracana]